MNLKILLLQNYTKPIAEYFNSFKKKQRMINKEFRVNNNLNLKNKL